MPSADPETLLNHALDVADRELAFLMEGQVDEAAALAEDRAQLIEGAWKAGTLQELKPLREKLVQLQSMQGRLTEEARKLHAQVRDELARSRQESRRHAGYGNSLKTTPSFTRFLSKRG
ncbi:hypothetical protein DPQ33_07910 [Oceanidesulfovibrio indonesiensis]|uniref:Flagellar protein FliT n=1 Tax=Oceanidesulfovibrio indonesiensis TaxID=54767 RepID=A0A7M3MEY3_9BACT|nr:hypothetical protein [Oceanidesulfovibrio indonesiensis]TVM17565.1 hypothetical protein DPQ33_07910 [Oceanidesulfovibrio indonesiensis]